MFKQSFLATLAGLVLFGGAASAQVNLTAETAGGATHLSPAHMTEIAGTKASQYPAG